MSLPLSYFDPGAQVKYRKLWFYLTSFSFSLILSITTEKPWDRGCETAKNNHNSLRTRKLLIDLLTLASIQLKQTEKVSAHCCVMIK